MVIHQIWGFNMSDYSSYIMDDDDFYDRDFVCPTYHGLWVDLMWVLNKLGVIDQVLLSNCTFWNNTSFKVLDYSINLYEWKDGECIRRGQAAPVTGKLEIPL